MEKEFLEEFLPCTSDLERTRTWTFCVYPDSAPADWKSILCKTGLPFAVSPLHDKDLEHEKSDTEKKSHWHVMLMYGNTTTKSCIEKLIEPLNCTRPFAVTSPRGLFRYFIHEDNPEKFQYDPNLRECYNGLDPLELLSKTDIQRCMSEIEEIIFKYDFSEYWSVLKFLADHDIKDLRFVFRTHTIHFNALLASIRHSRMQYSTECEKISFLKEEVDRLEQQLEKNT